MSENIHTLLVFLQMTYFKKNTVLRDHPWYNMGQNFLSFNPNNISLLYILNVLLFFSWMLGRCPPPPPPHSGSCCCKQLSPRPSLPSGLCNVHIPTVCFLNHPVGVLQRLKAEFPLLTAGMPFCAPTNVASTFHCPHLYQYLPVHHFWVVAILRV